MGEGGCSLVETEMFDAALKVKMCMGSSKRGSEESVKKKQG